MGLSCTELPNFLSLRPSVLELTEVALRKLRLGPSMHLRHPGYSTKSRAHQRQMSQGSHGANP